LGKNHDRPSAYRSGCHHSLREVEAAYGAAKGRGRGLPKGEGRRFFRPGVAGMARACPRAGGGQAEDRWHGAQERRAGAEGGDFSLERNRRRYRTKPVEKRTD
ncbi:unnamed protein product, partial [Ectocarpus sp. 12 AP-2014]